MTIWSWSLPGAPKLLGRQTNEQRKRHSLWKRADGFIAVVLVPPTRWNLHHDPNDPTHVWCLLSYDKQKTKRRSSRTHTPLDMRQAADCGWLLYMQTFYAFIYFEAIHSICSTPTQHSSRRPHTCWFTLQCLSLAAAVSPNKCAKKKKNLHAFVHDPRHVSYRHIMHIYPRLQVVKRRAKKLKTATLHALRAVAAAKPTITSSPTRTYPIGNNYILTYISYVK